MTESRVLGPKTGPERRAGYQINIPPTTAAHNSRIEEQSHDPTPAELFRMSCHLATSQACQAQEVESNDPFEELLHYIRDPLEKLGTDIIKFWIVSFLHFNFGTIFINFWLYRTKDLHILYSGGLCETSFPSQLLKFLPFLFAFRSHHLTSHITTPATIHVSCSILVHCIWRFVSKAPHFLLSQKPISTVVST